jgi:hypothetical protein
MGEVFHQRWIGVDGLENMSQHLVLLQFAWKGIKTVVLRQLFF